MRRSGCIIGMCVAVLAGPACAVDLPKAELMDVLGGHGCTLGEDSINAAIAAGLSMDDIRFIALTAQAEGVANAQGGYVVFDEDVCTIRLPDIQTQVRVDDPAIQAIAPYIREDYDTGTEIIVTEGCFAQNGAEVFRVRANGDADKANVEYLEFLAAHIMSGDLRFHAPSALGTPTGFQITVGDCAAAPNLADVAVSYPFIASHFGTYVRRVGAATPCGSDAFPASSYIAADIQGADVTQVENTDPTVNAWLYFELDIITYAAGWHEGMSGTSRGVPRPPLCHYP